MAISATFYKNDKKVNSTKLPVSSPDDIMLSVELKDVVNLFTPSLIISTDTFVSGGHIINPMKWNYCYLPDFERYYFVRSWSWVLGRWECSLEVDVMASFKTEIGNTSAFVLRAASQYDPDLIDTKYPTETQISGAEQDTQTPSGNIVTVWNTNIKNASIDDGFYVISVINDDDNAIGGVSHYALSAYSMAELMNKLYSAPTWMGITDANISNDLQKMLINPIQYINSCMWIPVGFTGGVGVRTIPIGWWSITLSTGYAYRLDTANCVKDVSVSFPLTKTHPQFDAQKRRWLQLSPFTTAALYFPPFGFIPLDMTKIYMSSSLEVSVRLDVITGKGTLFIGHKYKIGNDTFDGGTIYTTVSQVGVPVSVAQMSVDWNAISSASTWIGAAGVSLASGGLQDAIKSLPNTILSGAKDLLGGLKNAASQAWHDYSPTMGARRALEDAVDRIKWTASVQANDASLWSGGGASSAGSSGASLLSSIKQIASDIGSTALAAAGTCSSSGSSGGFAALQEQIFIQFYYQRITGTDDVHNGLPLARTVKINLLSGFVLCGNTDGFTANCTPAERQAVCGIMEAGFYYE